MRCVRFWLSLICLFLVVNGCSPLKAPTVVKYDTIESYRYVYIIPTKEFTSSVKNAYGNNNSLYSNSVAKSVNPSDVIAGILMKEGYVVLPGLRHDLVDETLIVNYGESGRRNKVLGYTIEVTIQFVSAKDRNLIGYCTAEGQGETEVDDIRKAISRALASMFSKN